MTSSSVNVEVRRPQGTEVGRVLLLPGAGYSVDHPLLHGAVQVMLQVGWRVAAARWSIGESDRNDPVSFTGEVLGRLGASAGAASRTLVLGKSVGSYAAGWAVDRGVPGIWLTPLLTAAAVARPLQRGEGRHLLIGGTADPAWDSRTAESTGHQVLEIPGADHSLEYVHNWRESLTALANVLLAVETFLLAE